MVVGGVLYISTAYGRIVALEPETGKKLWEYESAAAAGETRGPENPGGRLYVSALPQHGGRVATETLVEHP
jgi:outer membrane protein assembly factor BamB